MDWKDILHYGSAAGLVFLGVLGAMGLHIPGVTIDPATCFATGGGIFAAGLKGPAKAVFLLPMLLLFSPASAANLAPPTLKAAPAIYDPIGSGGWFVGAGTQLVSSKETIANTNILSQSGSLGVIGGYGRGNGVSWWQLQGEVYWKNLDGNGFCGIGTPCAVSSSFSAGAWLKVGGPLTKALLNALPQVGSLFPGLSTTTLADNVFPYLALGTAPEDVSATLGLANARAWTIPVGARAGMITKLTNGTVSDTGIEVDFAGSGFALGGAKVNPGVAYKAYLHFAIGA